VFTESDVEQTLRKVLPDMEDMQQAFASALSQARAERIGLDRPVTDMESGEVLTERVELAREEKACKARLKQLEDRKKILDPAIEEYAAEADLEPPYKIAGGTISFTHRLWAKVNREGDEATAAEKAAAINALDAAGMGDYAPRTFQVQSLSSFYKQELEEGRFDFPVGEDGLPADKVELFDGAIVVSKTPAVAVRVK
jgi:hypothetical protein